VLPPLHHFHRHGATQQELETITTISQIASLLETCCFREVWAALQPVRESLLASVPGFDDAIRSFMLSTLQITYQAVPEDHVLESLGLDSAGFAVLTSSRGWTLDGGTVKIALNDDNTAKAKKVDVSGAMAFDQMTKILSSIAS